MLQTPTLDVEQMYQLMEEAQETFGIEFDPLPPPRLDLGDPASQPRRGCRIDLDARSEAAVPLAPSALCYTLWLRSSDFHQHRQAAAELIARLLTANPHTTLQVILEPTADPRRLTPQTLETLLAIRYRSPTYLDRYYSLHPGRLPGSKRLAVLLPLEWRAGLSGDWCRSVAYYATLLWQGDQPLSAPLEEYEWVIP